MAYRAGITKSVSMVANVSPKTIVAAIPPNTTSNSRGMLPNTVVRAAISTGRTLDTVASITAVCGSSPFLRWMFTSSSSTMTFFIIIPSNPNQPAMQKKPNWNPVMSNPITIPMMDSGRIRNIIRGCLKLPNSITSITISIIMARGKYLVNAYIASFWSLYCESQKKVYPSGRSMFSISSRISLCTSFIVYPRLTSHCAAIDNLRL